MNQIFDSARLRGGRSLALFRLLYRLDRALFGGVGGAQG